MAVRREAVHPAPVRREAVHREAVHPANRVTNAESAITSAAVAASAAVQG